MRRDFCNPINIPYQFQHYNNQASREAADPTLVLYKDRYYLFASMSGGFYYSDDLIEWKWHENRKLDLYRYAPDVRQVGEYLVFSASDRKNSTFYRTLDPLSDQFEKISEPFPFWDPDVFQDEDGRVYFYWGCDNVKPIYGVELDPEKLLPIGKPVDLISGCQTEHGWERPDYPGVPEKNGKIPFPIRLYMLIMRLQGKGPDMPYIEGAFMNKWNGRYYLQYAAPATELATYADGVYIGSSPLGPFTYQTHNPYSSKPGGFITGAGHGSTIEDRHGNLWHAATMRISVNANFERRVGIFPAGLDQDGILFCCQSFGDYPLNIPNEKFDPLSIRPSWMLLSYKKACTASSYLTGHEPELAADENIRTSWCARESSNEWLQMDLGKTYPVHAIQVNFAEVNVPMLKKKKSELSSITTSNRYIDTDSLRKTRYLLEGSLDGECWFSLTDKRDADTDLSHDYLRFEEREVRYLKITSGELPYGESFAISGLRVFGNSDGPKPAAVDQFTAVYTDPMTAKLCWSPANGAIGYDVKYGIAADKLYSSHMIYEASELLLTTLNKGQQYYIRIDSFNESGITEGTVGQIAPL
ncbi:MAG: family 43 glycosylhydrolase [Lachnospiraceae bacterium]|nr:family 43 glycosylhydrolase [Lachnospiraceae bacterium]